MYALTLDGSDKVVNLPAQESVLDACLAQGLELPYNCRSGECGECLAQLQSGTVRQLPATSSFRQRTLVVFVCRVGAPHCRSRRLGGVKTEAMPARTHNRQTKHTAPKHLLQGDVLVQRVGGRAVGRLAVVIVRAAGARSGRHASIVSHRAIGSLLFFCAVGGRQDHVQAVAMDAVKQLGDRWGGFMLRGSASECRGRTLAHTRRKLARASFCARARASLAPLRVLEQSLTQRTPKFQRHWRSTPHARPERRLAASRALSCLEAGGRARGFQAGGARNGQAQD